MWDAFLKEISTLEASPRNGDKRQTDRRPGTPITQSKFNAQAQACSSAQNPLVA